MPNASEKELPAKKIFEDKSLRSKVRVFRDRIHAGEKLAQHLQRMAYPNAFVMCIPAGGVPVGYKVASELKCRLDLAIVRKIQIPNNPEAGFGAVSPNGATYINRDLLQHLSLSSEEIDEATFSARKEIERSNETFREGRGPPVLSGKTVLLIDDGLASGYTMMAALKFARGLSSERVVVAVPTGSGNALEVVSGVANEVVCLNIRDSFYFAVADAYVEWHDLDDNEVLDYLERAKAQGLMALS